MGNLQIEYQYFFFSKKKVNEKKKIIVLATLLESTCLSLFDHRIVSHNFKIGRDCSF